MLKTQRFELSAGQAGPIDVVVDLLDDNGQPRDPSLLTAEIAVVAMGATPDSWTEAAWQVDYSTSPDTWTATVTGSAEGGGGDIELEAGNYDVWVRITDGDTVTPNLVYRLAVR